MPACIHVCMRTWVETPLEIWASLQQRHCRIKSDMLSVMLLHDNGKHILRSGKLDAAMTW